jgi:hypothetical protein
MEPDPDLQTYGPVMKEKILQLHTRFLLLASLADSVEACFDETAGKAKEDVHAAAARAKQLDEEEALRTELIVRALGPLAELTRLEKLDMRRNIFSAEAATALAGTLTRLSQLTELLMGSHGNSHLASPVAVAALTAPLVVLTSLTKLSTYEGPCSPKTIETLASALGRMPALTWLDASQLDLRGNDQTHGTHSDALEQLADSLKKTTNMKALFLPHVQSPGWERKRERRKGKRERGREGGERKEREEEEGEEEGEGGKGKGGREGEKGEEGREQEGLQPLRDALLGMTSLTELKVGRARPGEIDWGIVLPEEVARSWKWMDVLAYVRERGAQGAVPCWMLRLLNIGMGQQVQDDMQYDADEGFFGTLGQYADEDFDASELLPDSQDGHGDAMGALQEQQQAPGCRMSDETALPYAQDGSQELHKLDLDTVIIDDRSYRAPELQQMIFEELRDYCDSLSQGQGSRLDGRRMRGGVETPIDVFPGNLSYSQNARRLLKSSDRRELRQKAYIVDTQRDRPAHIYTPLTAGASHTEPSVLNQTTWKSCTLLSWLGDEHGKVGYLECTWKGKTRGGASDEDERDSNPDKIKVYTFFWLTGAWLEAVQEIDKEATKDGKRKRASSIRLDKPSPVLYIVLPADYRPIKVQDAYMCPIASVLDN